MKIISISLDPEVLNSKSSVSYRNRLYGEIVDAYSVIVHAEKDSILELNDKVTVYGVGGKSKLVKFFRIALLIRGLIREKKYDVLVSSDPYFFSFLCYCLAKRYHLGFEVHILSIEKLNPIRKMVAQFFVKRASSVRVSSTNLRDEVASVFLVPWKDISFVPVYVPTESLFLKKAQQGSALRLEQDTFESAFTLKYASCFNFLTVGTLSTHKNIDLQLHALHNLIGSHPQIMLHIIGEGPEKIILQEEASNLGIESRVVFYGHVEAEKLGMLYTLCNCVLLTSVQESIPTVILEAHTAKIPIIATDVGSAGEIIQDGENGLLIVPNDLTSLQNVMERIMTEENLEHRLRLKAELYMKNYWTLDQILAGYKQSWQKALANRL